MISTNLHSYHVLPGNLYASKRPAQMAPRPRQRPQDKTLRGGGHGIAWAKFEGKIGGGVTPALLAGCCPSYFYRQHQRKRSVQQNGSFRKARFIASRSELASDRSLARYNPIIRHLAEATGNQCVTPLPALPQDRA
jgi:hypothetical protein